MGTERDPEPAVLPEPKSASVVCPECGQLVRIRDVHAFILSAHLKVCPDLVLVNGE